MSVFDKKEHVYNVTLTNGEILNEIHTEGPLEFLFSGVAVNLIAVKDGKEKTIVLSKYQITKAELIQVKD